MLTRCKNHTYRCHQISKTSWEYIRCVIYSLYRVRLKMTHHQKVITAEILQIFVPALLQI